MAPFINTVVNSGNPIPHEFTDIKCHLADPD